MTVRPPSNFQNKSLNETAFDMLGHEILAEKASSLGRAGRMAEAALARLKDEPRDSDDFHAIRKVAAEAVHAYFIQRELCGLRRHQEVIREMGIPNEVLARLGAK